MPEDWSGLEMSHFILKLVVSFEDRITETNNEINKLQ